MAGNLSMEGLITGRKCNPKHLHLMKNKYLLPFVLFLFLANIASAQEKNELDFKPSAKPVVTVFANYHAGLGSNNDLSGFELNRAYFGYQFELTPNLSGSAILDAGESPSEIAGEPQKRNVYLKNAFLTWKENGFTVNGGLIKTLQFALPEKFWGYRYVAASFQDMYKMGPSADLGLTGEYQFATWLSADLSFTNGDGHREINKDNKYRYGAGVTFTPIADLSLRIYGDLYQQAGMDDDQQTLSFFAGYKNPHFSLGAEYNYQKNNKCVNENNLSGYSIYTTVPLFSKWKFFARFDNVDSSDEDDNVWNANTGETLIAGIEYVPIKQLKIAPSFRYVRSFDTAAVDYNKVCTVFCNVGFFW